MNPRAARQGAVANSIANVSTARGGRTTSGERRGERPSARDVGKNAQCRESRDTSGSQLSNISIRTQGEDIKNGLT